MSKWLGAALLFLGLLTRCAQPGPPAALLTALDETRQQFCPDRRVCIWEAAVSESRPWIIRGATNLPEAKAHLLERLEKEGIAAIDSIRLLPDARLEGKTYGLIAISVGNIRTEPRHAAELTTQAVLGTPLQVLDQQGEWFRILTPDPYIGWIDQGGLVRLDEVGFRKWQAAEKLIILEETGEVYGKPDPAGASVSDLVMGCMVENQGREGNFFRVNLPDGRSGYISGNIAGPTGDWLENARPGAGDLLHTARTLMGRPYLWGGASAKGMDCSGFTRTVFFRHGLILPRDASQQVLVGEEITTDSSFASLQPGDLLFFGRKASDTQPEKITHVAIYTGGGEFIHASGQVKVESLLPGAANYSAYRHSTFVRAKRIFTPDAADSSLLVANNPMYVINGK